MNAFNSADDVNLALECDDDDSLQTTQNGTHGRHQTYLGSCTKRGWCLLNEICTRWDSNLGMAESLLYMKCEVTNALKRIGKYDHCLAVDEWALLDEFTNFLQTFRFLTELVSCKVTSLSLIPLMRAEISYACRQTAKDCDVLKSVNLQCFLIQQQCHCWTHLTAWKMRCIQR